MSKIVHIITRLILGGAQENTLFTCEGQHAAGHDVTLISGPTYGPEGGMLDRVKQGGYKFIEVPELVRQPSPIKDFRCLSKLKKIITEISPDIVHTHSAKAGVIGRVAAGKFRESKLDCCCGKLRKFVEAQRACNTPKPLIIHTWHGMPFHDYQSSIKNKLAIYLEKWADKYTDGYISVANSMSQQAIEAGIGKGKRFDRVFSGMIMDDYINRPSDNDIASLRDKYGIPQDAVVLATIARISFIKHHEYIIESARTISKEFPQARWMFVGDGNVFDKQKALIEKYGLQDKFILTGIIPPEKIGIYLHASDMLIHTSLNEGLPRAIPQAMLAKKPAISFDVDGSREVINERTGVLVNAMDIAGLIEAQRRLIPDEKLRNEMGQVGFDFCSKEFDYKLMVERIQEVYNRYKVYTKYPTHQSIEAVHPTPKTSTDTNL